MKRVCISMTLAFTYCSKPLEEYTDVSFKLFKRVARNKRGPVQIVCRWAPNALRVV